MKKMIIFAALAVVSTVSMADEVPSAEAYSNALQIVRAYHKANAKPKSKIEKREVKGEREYAARLGVSAKALEQMKRRLQVLNATTNRPIEGVIDTRLAKAGVREKWAAAEYDAAFTRDVRKAAKKATKGLEKIYKTIQKERSKATDPGEIELLDALLEILASCGWYMA